MKTSTNKVLYLSVGLSALLFSVSYAFGIFIEIKAHNLNALNQILECTAYELELETIEACAEKAKEQFIFDYTPYNED